MWGDGNSLDLVGPGAERDEGRARTQPITSALPPRIRLGRKLLGNVGWLGSVFKGGGGWRW